jgi:hypothetical protein
MKHCPTTAAIAFFMGISVPLHQASAQGFLENRADTLGKNGLHLYNVTGSIGYSSLLSMYRYGNPAGGIDGNYAAAASITLGYSHMGPKSALSFMYVPSYSGIFPISGQNSFNQRLNLEFSTRFGSKWTFYIAGSTDDSTVEQFIFKPSALTQFVNGPATFDQLASAVIGGQADTLALGLPGQLLAYGSRVLSVGANAGITYRPSSRLRLSFTGNAGQYQARDNKRDSHLDQPLIPRSRFEQGNANVSYSLTPRTEAGVQLSTMKTRGMAGQYQTTTASGSIGRKLGAQWFASAQGGIGVFTSLERTGRVLPDGSSYIVNGTLGYKAREQTWAGTYNRMLADQYGLGSASTSSFLGSWSWRRPGLSWSIFASGGKQLLSGGTFGDFGTWQTSAGYSRALGRQASVSMEYSYLTDSVTPVRLYNNVNAHAVRVTMSWIPFLRDTPPLSTGTTQVTSR